MRRLKIPAFRMALLLMGALWLAGCTRPTSGATAPAALDAQVVSVGQKDVPIYTEWIGTLDGLVNADIKAQVSGYLWALDLFPHRRSPTRLGAGRNDWKGKPWRFPPDGFNLRSRCNILNAID
jgi:hypothetical protein